MNTIETMTKPTAPSTPRIKKDVHGILILDKPLGLTSNAALQKVKRLFSARKAGHSGSLDPVASGMLPICFGEGTKYSQFLLEGDKKYFLSAKLGVRTDSGDSEGQIISTRDVPNLTLEDFEPVLAEFRGEISQIPSMFSAIKHKGQPLYKLARQGISIPREPRAVKIYELELVGYQNGVLSLQVTSSKGTYMRTLVDDIGEKLGCGAHIITLRRLQAGPYKENQMISMMELERILEEEGSAALEKTLLPIESAISNWPELQVSDAALFYLRQGQPVIVPYAPKEGWVRLVSKSNNRFLGIGEVQDDGRVAPRRLNPN